MDPNAATIVDCTRIHAPLACQDAAVELRLADFQDVSVAGLADLYIAACGGKQ